MSDKITYILEILDKYSVNTKKFKKELGSIQRASESLDKCLKKTGRSFKSFSTNPNLTKTIRQVNSLARSLERVKLNSKFAGFGRGTTAMGESMAMMNANLRSMITMQDRMISRVARTSPSSPVSPSPARRGFFGGGGSGVSFGGVARAMGYYAAIDRAIGMPREILDMRRQMDSLGATFEAVLPKYDKVTKSTVLAARETEYLKKKTYELGLDFDSTKSEYVKFLAAGSMSGQSLADMRKQFEAFAKISTVYQLPAHRFGLVMNAITQMTSKSTVSMEELKRQLGDSLPGAMTIFAKAAIKARPDIFKTIGDFIKMVEQGKVSADILKVVADVILEDKDLMNGLGKALDSTNSKLNRLSNSWGRFVEKLSTGKSGEMIGDFIVGLDDAIKLLTKSLDGLADLWDSRFIKFIREMIPEVTDTITTGTKVVGAGGMALINDLIHGGNEGREQFMTLAKKGALASGYKSPEPLNYTPIPPQSQKITVEIIGNNLPENMSIAPRNQSGDIDISVKRGNTLSYGGGY